MEKATPTTPTPTPSAAKSRYSDGLRTANAGNDRNGWSPSIARPTTSAVTLANTTTPKDSAAKLRRISSIAKNTPASGALNVAAIPPAAPQATSNRIRSVSRRRTWATVEPAAEPICTIGPSRPTEPPPPMHSADASALTRRPAGRSGRRDD